RRRFGRRRRIGRLRRRRRRGLRRHGGTGFRALFGEQSFGFGEETLDLFLVIGRRRLAQKSFVEERGFLVVAERVVALADVEQERRQLRDAVRLFVVGERLVEFAE